MRQPWDRSQRFPVIAAGGEFGTSRLTKSEPSSRDSCKPEVLCSAQHVQDLPPPKCGGCGWLAFREGGRTESEAELRLSPSPAAGVRKRLQGVGLCAWSQPAQQIKVQSDAVQNLLHIESQRGPWQSFPGGASAARASTCVLKEHRTIRGGTLGRWAGALEDASPSLASTAYALLPEGTFAPPVW